MNLLIDESVDRPIVARLREDGHKVLYVAEMEPGITDEVVLSRANEISALLITADKDFGELVFRLGQVNAGVLLLRLLGLSSKHKAEIVAATIRQHTSELPQSFSVLSPNSFRVRRKQER